MQNTFPPSRADSCVPHNHPKLLLRVKIPLETVGCSAGIPTELLAQKGKREGNFPN